MKTEARYSFLSRQEQDKIKHRVEVFDDTGLYGQFPHANSYHEALKVQIKNLFVEAEESILTILSADDFASFKSYIDGSERCVLIAENLHKIITGEIRASKCLVVWSINRGDNRNLMLVIHENKLKLCISEYVYQNEHMEGQGVHWYRIISDREKLEHDSYRLHEALKILANPKTAWEYLRARVCAFEVFLNNR